MHSCIKAFICLRALIRYVTNCSVFNCWKGAYSVHEILPFGNYSFWHEQEFLYHSITLKRAVNTFFFAPSITQSQSDPYVIIFCVCVKKHYYSAIRNLENLRSLCNIHLTVILGIWTKQMLVRHFKKEVHFMLGSTGRPLSLLCHLLASTANYSFPRTGTVSPWMWSSGAQGDGKILTAEVRNDVLTHRAVQGSLHPAELTSDRAYALQHQRCALQCAGRI